MKKIHLKLKRSTLVFALLVIPFVSVKGDTLNISLAKMPIYAESKDKGVLVDLSKLIARELGMELNLAVVPFARSINKVVTGEVDLHMPLIESPGYRNEVLQFDYSTTTIFHVNFVLYENKGKRLDKKQLGNYKIETDRAHINYFPFDTIPSSCLECSLKKVNVGRIDGFIFADFAADPLIKKNGLTNLNRSLYRVFDVKIVLIKGGRGGAVDKMLTQAIESLTAKGSFGKLMEAIDVPYNDWQP